MTTIELTKSGIAMKKLRGDPEKYLNERRRDVLRYVEIKVVGLSLKIGGSMGLRLRRSWEEFEKEGMNQTGKNFPSSFELTKMEYLYQTSSVLRRRRLREQVKIHE